MPFDLTFQAFPAPDGPLRYALVPWDSDLYGFPFYDLKAGEAEPAALALHLPAWLAGLPSARACLVCAKLAPGDVPRAQALAANGFYPVETLVDFHLRLARLATVIRRPQAGERLRMAAPADEPRVAEIAVGAFAADRFHLDPNLPPGKADERFRRWVGRSFAAREPIFVLEDLREKQVLGFVQCRDTSPGLMDVTLGAVDRAIQKTGAGVLMYQLLFVELIARGYREAVTRVSLHNLGGIKLTLRLGFTVRSAVTTLHWFRSTLHPPPSPFHPEP